MAKRGRPSKKTLKKRKFVKRESNCLLIVAFGCLVLLGFFLYYFVIKKGI